MINATKARSVYLKKARKTVAKTIRQAVKEGKSFVEVSFFATTFEVVAPIIKQWLESMGYSAELQRDGLTMRITWL